MANDQAARDAFESDGFRTEAAVQFGFRWTNDDADEYACTEAALVAFAKACERAGLRKAREMARTLASEFPNGVGVAQRFILEALAIKLDRKIAAIDAELVPVLAAEEARFMTAQGYVPAADDQPGARWIKRIPKPGDQCPKCGSFHGNDWSQCGKGPCPMGRPF